jgi:uncharacterized protein (TIGR02099 family)
MRRRYRRLWTLTLTLGATLLIAAVVVVAGFRVLVKAVPGYRGEIEQRASVALDRRLTIRELDLSWRRFRPSFDLLEVTLYGDDDQTPALRLRELNLGIDWLALLIGQLRLSELRLAGLALTVERLADGSLHVSGISSDKPLTAEELRRLARAAERVDRLVIAESQVLWLDYTDPDTFHRIGDIELALSSRGSRHRLSASAQLPVNIGGSLRLEASARGDIQSFETLEIDADVQADGLRAGVWLQPWLREGLALEGDAAQFRLGAQWRGPQLQTASGGFSSGPLRLRRAGRASRFLDDLQSDFRLAATQTGGWRVQLERLTVDAPTRQPAMTSGSFEYRPAGPARTFWLSGSLNQLRLDEIGEWLALFDWGERGWIAGLQPVGHVQDLRFHYEGDTALAEGAAPREPRYALQGRFEGLGLSAERSRPGVTGATGRVKLDQAGGELLLMVRNGQLLAPETFDQPLPLAELSGSLNWRREGSDWLLGSQQLRWHGPGDLAGRADLALRLFGAGGTPRIDLDASFAGQDIDAVRPFIPRVPDVLDEDVRAWLHSAIRSGKVSQGRLQIRGLLNHFPYHNPHEPGLFRIDFDVRDGVLEYAEDWPRIERISTHVAFQGRSMLITADSGRILGTPVGPVRVEVKDFKTPLLEVQGVAADDAGKMLGFLIESPLRKDYAALVQALKLQGPARLDLRLEIPLDQLEATRVFGKVGLDGRTQLNHAKLPEPIRAITGEVRFDNSGLSARELRGELLGLQLLLQMDPERQGERHFTRLQAVTEAAFPRDAARLARLASADALARLRGSSRWQADMLFDTTATPARLQLNSDLAGLAVNLPPPFGKAAEESLPVAISLDPSAASGLRAEVSYGSVLRAALQLADRDGRWALDRGHVHLGAGTAQLPRQPGLWLDGELPELDLALWQGLLSPAPATPPASAPPAKPEPLLQRADLRIGRLLVADQRFENLRLQLAREGAEWLLTANAPALEGSLRWPLQAPGRTMYRAELQRLQLRAPERSAEDADAAADDRTPPRDPATLPGLSLRCRSLRVNEHELGQLQVEAVPVPAGLSLTTFSLKGDLELQGSGSWTRTDGESSAQLSLSARGRQLRPLFEALGYAPSLDAEKVRVQASLAWAPHAGGLKTETLGGGFHLDLENGVLMAVEPGAGRVLGLLNFYALPRRLTLDFRDVVSKGLAFDTLKGDFRIEQGNAWTDNLRIRGPSLKMEIEGRVGLAARDYDQKVTIHPQLTPGVALAGTLAGGPAVGLGILLAQQLFRKPIEEMSELSYRLRGPWDNPTIDKDG